MARRAAEPVSAINQVELPKSDTVTAEELTPICDHIISVLEEKDKQYAASWKKRGGVGAFMMLARKWDRLENFVTSPDSNYDPYDILKRATQDGRDEGVEEDIADLIGYLLLVLVEIKKLKDAQKF